MSPVIVAAIIAGCFGILTVVGTLAVQLYGSRRTSRDTKETLKEQLAEQRTQLDRTLAEQRARTLNERFATAADMLSADKPPVIRLAGVHAMSGLADDWEENQQICVNVLCACLRLPDRPDPGDDAPEDERLAYRATREVRHSIVRAITAHLRNGAAVSWQGLDLDLTGAVFDGGDFSDAVFAGGEISFREAKFTGKVNFLRAEFTGGQVKFDGADFVEGWVSFRDAVFVDGRVSFRQAAFSGSEVSFDGATFKGGAVNFGASFAGGRISFISAEFTGSRAHFVAAEFAGSAVTFYGAKFRDGRINFVAEFIDGRIDFEQAEFTGSRISFVSCRFYGGKIDFSKVADWSKPPEFDWHGKPSAMVKLPKKHTMPTAQACEGRQVPTA
jgi:uncharacterized protein YjbI with pentapeptide repeats